MLSIAGLSSGVLIYIIYRSIRISGILIKGCQDGGVGLWDKGHGGNYRPHFKVVTYASYFLAIDGSSYSSAAVSRPVMRKLITIQNALCK